MSKLLITLAVLAGMIATANADVWKWVDANGKTHYVDTMTPIYTWVDDFGKTHYSDTPDHEDAVSVELVWHSSGSLDDVTGGGGKADAYPDETPEQRAEREKLCQKATEVYESYLNAPQLYRTGADGEREFLSEKEVAATIADTLARKQDYCR